MKMKPFFLLIFLPYLYNSTSEIYKEEKKENHLGKKTQNEIEKHFKEEIKTIFMYEKLEEIINKKEIIDVNEQEKNDFIKAKNKFIECVNKRLKGQIEKKNIEIAILSETVDVLIMVSSKLRTSMTYKIKNLHNVLKLIDEMKEKDYQNNLVLLFYTKMFDFVKEKIEKGENDIFDALISKVAEEIQFYNQFESKEEGKEIRENIYMAKKVFLKCECYDDVLEYIEKNLSDFSQLKRKYEDRMLECKNELKRYCETLEMLKLVRVKIMSRVWGIFERILIIK
ncbi:hypothetical protein EDEG_02313 [Edhazardia aedis USNM 41457]|uniref:Uncharacterized protein n=1 Tax=Edhazardia aedis (strain USNM 41457) TaxID=1003232 RepID=J9D6C9_EDHAE|nr:hypothetical protein EDEG_02313 [Edhazardia aedis USNM 41457]|eukprot:EJW03356.1 hypothetical protein EDEG_02313 [Edhazardia aedis USNM 41457]